MRIAVIGAGGVGGAFGVALGQAGADVTFVARGAHLAAMKSNGLKIQGGRGERHLVPTRATDNPADIGAVDIVLFCVKLWDVESAGEHIRPLIGKDTAVIPLQNGIDAAERLIPILGEKAVMGGVAQISANANLFDHGAIKVGADGRFAMDVPKAKHAVTDLTHRIMTIQATGDYAAADALLKKMGRPTCSRSWANQILPSSRCRNTRSQRYAQFSPAAWAVPYIR